MNDIEADMEATKTFDYIRKKIADMKTVPHGKLLQHYVQYSDPYFFNIILHYNCVCRWWKDSRRNTKGGMWIWWKWSGTARRSFAQSLNEDYNRNQNEDHNGNQNEDVIEDIEMENEAAIQENDTFSDEAEPTVEDQEGLSDDEEKWQKGMEVSLPNWESRHPEQTMQFSAQNDILGYKMYIPENCTSIK